MQKADVEIEDAVGSSTGKMVTNPISVASLLPSFDSVYCSVVEPPVPTGLSRKVMARPTPEDSTKRVSLAGLPDTVVPDESPRIELVVLG